MFGKDNEANAFNFPQNENVATHQFSIGYDTIRKKYSIKDSKEGTGVFVKMNKLEVLEGQIFSFMNIFIIVQAIQDDVLKLRFISSKTHEGTEYSLDPHDKRDVLIGRRKGVDIECSNEGVSRVQCTFSFICRRWYLIDGQPGKPSRNGIWLLASKQTWIDDQMVIKTGYTTFKATLV